MNVMLSLSNTPMAHPPRLNPLLRSSSDTPPFPCITPSTVTCVMVVSFMIANPFSWGAPRGRALTPATNIAAPIRHGLADVFRGLLVAGRRPVWGGAGEQPGVPSGGAAGRAPRG